LEYRLSIQSGCLVFLFFESYGSLSEAEYASVALPSDKLETLLDEIDGQPYVVEDMQDIRWAILDELGAWQPWTKLDPWPKPFQPGIGNRRVFPSHVIERVKRDRTVGVGVDDALLHPLHHG
jgi:hypothetical protein